MASQPIALTPQQVISWPVPVPLGLTISGETLPTETAAERTEAFLLEARERFSIGLQATDTQRSEAQEDQDFALGEQWDDRWASSRRTQGRPALVINRIPQFISHVANNMRQSNPAIKIEPAGDGADEEIAEVRQGEIRHIENISHADIAYDEAFEQMCIMGLSWLRVVDDWAAPDSFDKDLFIRWIQNPFSVYFDPFCSLPDWSDGKWAFITEDLTRQEFISRFGEDRMASATAFSSKGNEYPGWFPAGKIRIAEYFQVKQKQDTLCELQDGTTMIWSKLSKLDLSLELEQVDGVKVLVRNNPDGSQEFVGNTRPSTIPEVHWALITAVDILEERTWKGTQIPLIPIIGNQTQKDGERIISGMVRFAREPQRMYNYMYSSFVESIALTPKAPYIAEIDQVPDGLIEEWSKSNQQPTAVLRYKRQTDSSGNLLPMPSRQSTEPPIGAFVQGLNMAEQMLKSVFSIYDASLGQRGPDESGIAINARKIESDTGTYNWGDNFIRSLRRLGTVLNELLPHYYNTPGRILQITREDGSKRQITLNKPFDENGQTKHFDLSKDGRYSVVVSTGASYPTRRKETANALMDLMKVYPNLFPIAGDIVVKELDFPGKDALAARIEKTLPPGLKDQDPNGPQIPPVVQGQLQQMQQMIQQLTQALHAATDKNDLEKMKQLHEDFRTQMTQEVALAVANIKSGSDEAKYMNDKIFGELERIRQSFEAQQQQAQAPPTAVQPGQPQPNLAQTAGAEPSVGGG